MSRSNENYELYLEQHPDEAEELARQEDEAAEAEYWAEQYEQQQVKTEG